MTEDTNPNVAEKATITDVLPLDGLTVIGIIDAPSGAAALLRSNRGRIEKVTTGEQAMGFTVAAISPEQVVIVDRSGTSYTLGVPGS